MTSQAQNSISLYAGQPVSSIKQALKFQKQSVVKELMEHFGMSNIEDLAVRLSMG